MAFAAAAAAVGMTVSGSYIPDFGPDFNPTSGPNMNGNYTISNTPGGTPGLFPKAFTVYPGGVEAYDVVTPPMTTYYSQVWWSPLAPADFPKEMVTKYAGKAVAVVGWEIDQVFTLPNGEEHSVPISASYNHHYNAQIIGASAKFRKVKLTGPDDPMAAELLKTSGHGMLNYDEPYYVAEQIANSASGAPVSAFVTSGNGGEYRKTYHGFPPGYAVVIDSPTQLQISPMQIDTWNRDAMNISEPFPPPFVAGPLPRASEAPINASYSGLLECPMTTRLTKVIDGNYIIEANSDASSSPCAASNTSSIMTFQECFHAAAVTLGSTGQIFVNTTVSSSSLPAGCSISTSPDNPLEVNVVFNTLSSSTVSCGMLSNESGLIGSGAAASLVFVKVDVSESGDLVTLTLEGPKDVWYGVGFGAHAMADEPWTVVVDGSGNVTEHKIGGQQPNSHVPGVQLATTVKVMSMTVTGLKRRVILTRSLQGAGPDYYTFNASASNPTIPFINAVGNGPDFAYHKDKTPASLTLLPVGAAGNVVGACVCPQQAMPFGQATGELVYHAGNQSVDIGIGAVAFGKQKCKPFPATVLNEQKNPTCDIRFYKGGQWACHHKWSLLDADQEIPWTNQPLIFSHKWRIYVQPYNASYHTKLTYGFHTSLVIGSPYEYDVPKCAENIPGCANENGTWVHTITGNKIGDNSFVSLNFHCHAPTCISMSVYACDKGVALDQCNTTNGKLLCEQHPIYGGSGAPELNGTRFDESGYIAIPDCFWGDEAFGLESPPDLTGVPLHVVKKANATWAHYGEMAGGQPFVF